jgi:hypothetical protein
MELEATHLRGNEYAVRPRGQLGTCGWHPKPWAVTYVRASSPDEAVRNASCNVFSPIIRIVPNPAINLLDIMIEQQSQYYGHKNGHVIDFMVDRFMKEKRNDTTT